MTKLNAVRDYGMKLPAANGKTATIGFCWGGKQSFAYAVAPARAERRGRLLRHVAGRTRRITRRSRPRCSGLYGADDARVNATIEPAKAAMKDGGKTYTPHIYDGAGHGFLRQQDGKDGANLKAAQQAWPETVKFLKEHSE